MFKKLSLVCAVGLFSCLAFSQSNNGRILGTVTDPSGAVVVGAIVRAYGPLADPQSTTTDATGRWSLPNLPAGWYSLAVMVPGFAT